MHKELNAMKGGVDRMARRWKEFNDGKLLIVMMSKSKAVAADSGMVLEEEFVRGHQDQFWAFSIQFLGTHNRYNLPRRATTATRASVRPKSSIS